MSENMKLFRLRSQSILLNRLDTCKLRNKAVDITPFDRPGLPIPQQKTHPQQDRENTEM